MRLSWIFSFYTLQDQNSTSGSFFLSLISTGNYRIEEMDEGPGPWTSQLRELLLCIIDSKKSSLPVSASQEALSTGIVLIILSFVLCNS